MKEELKTKSFDAILNAPLKVFRELRNRVKIKFPHLNSSFYGNMVLLSKADSPLVRFHLSKPILIKFKEEFEVKEFKGVVLNMNPDISKGKRKKAYLSFLSSLVSSSESEALALFADFHGLKGLRKTEIINFLRKKEEDIEQLILDLERKGKIKIISFSPLFLVSPKAIEHLKSIILSKLNSIMERNPLDFEINVKTIIKKTRIKVDPRLFTYTLKKLGKEKKITISEDTVILPPPVIEALSKEESEALKELLEILHSVSIYKLSTHEIEKKIGLPTKVVYRLLYLLIMNKKIVRVKTDFFISSSWIEELTQKLKDLRGKRLSIADFRRLTGLSRQYLIPLLEFLDEKGITRRVGNSREILI